MNNDIPDGSETFSSEIENPIKETDPRIFQFSFKTLAMINDADSIAVVVGNLSREYQITPMDIIQWARNKEYTNSNEEKQTLYNEDLIEEKLSNLGFDLSEKK